MGQHMQSTMMHPMHRKREYEKTPFEMNPNGLRVVMGFPLPVWQRPLVWTMKQRIRFLESAWLGLNLGTFTYNDNYNDPEYDGLLLDGQQRLYAVEQYLSDEFEVFGYHWSELSPPDTRRFGMNVHFNCFITNSNSETYMREYYDLMNFGGTAHTEDQRAIRASA